MEIRPGPGELVAIGSDVLIIVSDGPEPVRVPAVVGRTEAQARNTLTEEGLVPSVSYIDVAAREPRRRQSGAPRVCRRARRWIPAQRSRSPWGAPLPRSRRCRRPRTTDDGAARPRTTTTTTGTLIAAAITGRRERAGGRSASRRLAGSTEEVGQQVVALTGQDALRVELHAFDRERRDDGHPSPRRPRCGP